MTPWFRKQTFTLPLLVLLVTVVSTAVVFQESILAAPVVFLIGCLVTYLETITLLSFRAPSNKKPPLEHEGWHHVHHAIGPDTVSTYHRRGHPNRPTVILCHGWMSGAVRMEGRAQTFLEQNWSVVMLDLPSHGDSSNLSKWTAERSCSLIIEALNRLSREHELFESNVHFYGHSMGGFIGLRLSHRREELLFGEQLRSWIFESPMTGYSEIHRETMRLLRVPPLLRGIVLRKTIRHFNALNRGRPDIHHLDEADMPQWGMPLEKTLLLQASPDERLGDEHYLRLIACLEPYPDLLEVHLLNDLTHSGSHHHEGREQIVDVWIRNIAGKGAPEVIASTSE